MKIYQVSGLGANGRAFKRLCLNENFEQVNIPWLVPEKRESLTHYTERLLENIDTSEDFILMGLSFGGIIVQEMYNFINPKHIFLISTVKNRNEIPSLFKLLASTKLHKLLPINFLTSDYFFSYMTLRRLYYNDRKKDNIDDIFEYKNKDYLKWSIDKIVNWDNSGSYSKENITHIHGTKDIVFPMKNIKSDISIEGGSHIMIIQKPKQISKEINKILKVL